MASFSSPFLALPHPKTTPILDIRGRPVNIDIYDPGQWRKHQWGVYSPEVVARVRDSAPTPGQGERDVAHMQQLFEDNLRRAERMQWALSAPLPPLQVDIATFGGDCESTPGHAVMLDEAAGGQLVFRTGQLPVRGKAGIYRADLAELMFEPGDGLVTRTSQTARRPPGWPPAAKASTCCRPGAVSSCASRTGA
jgi:hypothetical protein